MSAYYGIPYDQVIRIFSRFVTCRLQRFRMRLNEELNSKSLLNAADCHDSSDLNCFSIETMLLRKFSEFLNPAFPNDSVLFDIISSFRGAKYTLCKQGRG